MTFEHRHENKSCSACRDRVNERVKVVKVAKVARVKVFQVFQNIPGSQLLSDIQTFFRRQSFKHVISIALLSSANNRPEKFGGLGWSFLCKLISNRTFLFLVVFEVW